jgi:hypothetical protein
MDLNYCPKTLVDYDALLGEDAQRAFQSSFIIEGYMENVDGFMGDKNFLNKTGLDIEKQATFIMAKRRFDEVVLELNWRDFWKATNTYAPNDAVHEQGTVFINTVAVNNSQLTLTDVTGVFTKFDPVMGVSSGTIGLVSSFDPLTNILILMDVVGTFILNEFINDTLGNFSSPESISGDEIFNSQTTGIGTISAIRVGTNVPPQEDPTHWKVMTQIRPKEGDLIYLPLTGDIFEILFADHEEVFYQLGKIYVWKLTCEKFSFSHEKLETGIDAIDDIATELENDDSVINDPLSDNQTIDETVERFLNLDPKSPFQG